MRILGPASPDITALRSPAASAAAAAAAPTLKPHLMSRRLPDIAAVFQAYSKFGHDRGDLFIPLARWVHARMSAHERGRGASARRGCARVCAWSLAARSLVSSFLRAPRAGQPGSSLSRALAPAQTSAHAHAHAHTLASERAHAHGHALALAHHTS
jgi:hypothetical protein